MRGEEGDDTWQRERGLFRCQREKVMIGRTMFTQRIVDTKIMKIFCLIQSLYIT